MSLSRLLFLISIVLVSPAFSSLKTGPNSVDNPLATAQEFLGQFEEAVLKHDLKGVLSFFDEAYRKEQHDQFLQGNTEQFVKDFFCGNTLKTETFSCLSLNEIIKMKRVSLALIDENECAFRYKLKAQDRIVILYAAMFRRTYNGVLKWGIVGAVG